MSTGQKEKEKERKKMNFKEAYLNSDLMTYAWKGCKGCITGETLYIKSESLLKLTKGYFKKGGGYKGLEYDKAYPITFYKMSGRDYIAWCVFEDGKWKVLKDE